MATETVPPLTDERRLALAGVIFSRIATLANTADELLDDPNTTTALSEAIRHMVITIGATADMGIKVSGSSIPQIKGPADEWLGLTTSSVGELSHG